MQSSTTNPQQASPQPQDPDEARRARRRVAAEQRKRIANACLACKSRKQKCDGQQPCNICSRRGASCVYVEQPPRHLKRRRATPQTGDDPSDRTSTRSPCSPGHLNLQAQPPPTQTAASPQSHRRDSVSNVSAVTTDIAAGTRLYVYPTPVTGNPNPIPTSQTEATDSTDDDDRVEAPVDHRTRMLSDPNGRLLYIGETGTLSFLARVRKLVENTLGPSNFTSDAAQNSIADKPAVPRQHSAVGTLPTFQSATELGEHFFANVNCVHYVLDRIEWADIIHSVYSGAGSLRSATGDRNRDVAMVNAVCAVGTFFMAQSDLSAQEGMRYFDIARTVMEDVFESADFWSVRLLLLFALYMHHAAKRNASWTYIGLAIRIAESLGLHRISTIEHSSELFRGGSERWENERRRRLVFWTLYNLDRFEGCSLGRPLAIQDEDCNDPVFSTAPSNDPLVNHHCNGDPTDPNHYIHLLVAKVRLHIIVGHIVKQVYLRRSISRDVAESLSDELKAWWNALPQCASLDNMNRGGNWAIVQLHMSYLHAVALLTRPFLQRVVEAKVEETTGKTADGNCQCKRKSSSKSNVKRKMLRYVRACVLVAERTVALAHRMRRQGKLQRNDAAFIYYLFTAGLILTFSVLPQVLCPREDGSEDDMAQFRNRSTTLINLMAECASVEASTAKRYHHILKSFAEALIQSNERRQQEMQAQKTGERDPSDTEDKPVEPDLLDELWKISNEYFAGSYQQSRAPSAEPASRESVAAHALVSVASHGQMATPHNPLLTTYLDSSGPPPPMPLTPSGVHHVYDTGPPPMMDKDSEMVTAGMFGLTDFSSFLGWLDESRFAENQAIPWEFSWDGSPSAYYMTTPAGMSPHGRPGM